MTHTLVDKVKQMHRDNPEITMAEMAKSLGVYRKQITGIARTHQLPIPGTLPTLVDPMQAGALCGVCGSNNNTVSDSRPTQILSFPVVRRRRHCNECDARWTTYEIAEADTSEIEGRLHAADNLEKALSGFGLKGGKQ